MALLHIRRESLRRSFGKTKEIVTLPDLIEVQSRSFNNFIQLDSLPEERKKIGLEKVLSNVFPIEQGDKYSLVYCGYELGDWSCICGEVVGIEKRYTWKSKSGKKTGVSRLSKIDLDAGNQYIRCSACHSRVSLKMPYSVDEHIYGGRTYSMPLKIKLQLITWDVDGESVPQQERQIKEIKEQSIFICALPIMVGIYEDDAGNIRVGDRGIFVINGVCRVVVSQIHRAPGVLFSFMKKAKGSAFANYYNARIIPARGAWLDFEFDHNGILYVRIDKKKKILVTTFLQAIGVQRDELLYKFYDVLTIKAEKGVYSVEVSQSLCGMRVGAGVLSLLGESQKTLGSKLDFKRGMRFTKEIIEKLIKQGLSYLPISRESLLGKNVVNRVENPVSGEVLLKDASVIAVADLIELDSLQNGLIKVLSDSSTGATSCLVNTLSLDHVFDCQTAAKEVYGRIKPGDAPGFKIVEDYIKGMFFNSKYYDLSPVGRVRINRKLGLNASIEDLALSLEDILLTVKYLVNLQEKGEGSVDDIDDLSNRCVRLVDELLQNQAYLGFSRIEKIAKEKLRMVESNVSYTPYDFINVKPISAVLGAFFGTGQLSQFMDQTNPLSEMAHKRRLSALGQGGISRERATLDVRDVHQSHYGKICMIETPDGHNIGLISSLSIYSKVNELGFIETVYRPVSNGYVEQDKGVVTLDAYGERGKVIAQASVTMDENGKILNDKVVARKHGEFSTVSPQELDFIDVSTKQLVSVSTALIPFLEHDDANRALMGSNMQRQAVPLMSPMAPLVGTGVERDIAGAEGICVLAKNAGVVSYVSAERIIVSLDRKEGQSLEDWALSNVDVYELKTFGKSSHNTCVHFTAVVREGVAVSKGDLLADGPAVRGGELSLGNNICVAFMPWYGYNFEDAIVVSKRLVSDDLFTSIHIEEFVVEARDAKMGAEEITRDIPTLSERELENLDPDGIVKIGTRVSPGDILVAKATLKGDVQVSPEEKLLRAIFGDKSREVRDTSSRVKSGCYGTVIDVRVFSRSGIRKDKRYKDYVDCETAKVESLFAIKTEVLAFNFKRLFKVHVEKIDSSVLPEFDDLSFEDSLNLALLKPDLKKTANEFKTLYLDELKILQAQKKDQIGRLRRGDDLPSGVLKVVKVYVAMKRLLSVGDKMAGRHGNKGVVSKVVDVQDMPYLADGTPVDVVLNPLGIPARMNLGQLWETTLGMVCNKFTKELSEKIKDFSDNQIVSYLKEYMSSDLVDGLVKKYGKNVVFDMVSIIKEDGLKMGTPVFDGASFEKEIVPLLVKSNLPTHGKFDLFDGKTGEKFMQQVTVGYIYMMKLNHMADDKLHARSVGPYSLITQQPLGGKAMGGGQRLGEMEVWALFGYGAAYTLREMFTLKSDDINGRVKAFESIVHGEEVGEPGLPESFNVLVKELQSLGLSIDLFQSSEERFCE